MPVIAVELIASPGAHATLDQSLAPSSPALSERQRAVLGHALRLLVEGGERALTTAGVARAASCSKETLYKWFGDRDGLLAAVVAFQAAKVRVSVPGADSGDGEAFGRHLVVFAEDLLNVLAGDVSLALNRLAIGQASGEDAPLGRLVLDRGRRTIETRALALLDAGRAAGHLAFDDAREAYRTLYGLIVRDVHVRLLLGGRLEAGEADQNHAARTAVSQFLRLYGAATKPGPA